MLLHWTNIILALSHTILNSRSHSSLLVQNCCKISSCKCECERLPGWSVRIRLLWNMAHVDLEKQLDLCNFWFSLTSADQSLRVIDQWEEQWLRISFKLERNLWPPIQNNQSNWAKEDFNFSSWLFVKTQMVKEREGLIVDAAKACFSMPTNIKLQW